MKVHCAKSTMTFGIALVMVFVLAGGSIGLGQEVVSKAEVSGKIPLKILYVGVADTERSRDFVGFLSENFTEAKFANVRTFKEEHAKDSDVIILDKDGVEWGISRVDFPLTNIKFSEAYSKPTISMGIPGAFFTGEMKLKTDYM